MTVLVANVSASVNLTYQGAIDLGELTQVINYANSNAFSDGTGANQAQKVFSDTRTISASSSESLDLAGVLTDAFGATLTFAEIKALIIKAAVGNTNDVIVGGAASNAWVGHVGDATDTITVKPGGTLCLIAPNAAGYAVVASTGDILKVANSGGTTGVTYDIIIIGNP